MKKRVLAFALAAFSLIPLVSCAVPNESIGATGAVTTNAPMLEEPTETDTPTETEPTDTDLPETDFVTDAETEAPTPPEFKPLPEALDKNKTYNILFIGNSCTSKHDMPESLFKRIARLSGYEVNVKRIVKGGWYLDGHADPTDAAGKLVAEALAEKKWDYVVIQEQVRGFVENPVRFYDGARELVKKIRENGAIPILYSTWSYNRGHSYLDQHNLTYKKKTYTIAGHCEAIGKELGIEVAYVGLAFLMVDAMHGYVDDLYETDKVHSSLLGSNLAALTIFSTIFNVDPSIDKNVRWKPAASEYDELFRKIVSKIVFEDPIVPDKYKENSEGKTNKK